ncbi:phosphotransferase system cellobiose-specific component IIA [Halobacteroides halobius DSM 5150]|uniref:Phosphotransferase system cellobiose-specific component IIA n=1 Tax=Halobacteroides halobius (strain ATCC 35273 / DSM 5150 / MD-1) TaxID=748449 RepID=L0KCA9_HALHC|nr:PTS lactose/cellobiose transporter subunit IIA [Halobacteroides halobius]AGB42009.1 phosphotransferase system cellobiose-specific component IIA [Halobacteroides halobius DSM 5150]
MSQQVNLNKVAFNITLHGGNAKDLAHDALKAAKEGNNERAENLLEEAREEFNKGHEVQSQAMKQDDKEDKVYTNMLLAHAMDHLMAAKSEMVLIEELIELHQKVEG